MRKHVSSLILYDGKVLLLHRDNIPTIPDPGTWQSISGHVEEGEEFDDAIVREIKEETNLSPKNIRYLGKVMTSDDIIALYLVRLSDDEVKDLKLGNEGQELKFYEVNDVEKLNLTPSVRAFINKYKLKLIDIVNGLEVTAEDFDLKD